MNPRSTDCEADALTTTPSRRLSVLVGITMLLLHADKPNVNFFFDRMNGALHCRHNRLKLTVLISLEFAAGCLTQKGDRNIRTVVTLRRSLKFLVYLFIFQPSQSLFQRVFTGPHNLSLYDNSLCEAES